MKDIKDVNGKELKEVVKELNESGLIKKKIKLVGISNLNLLKEFTDAIEGVTEDDENVDIPQGIADFYNDLYADEIDTEDEDSSIDEEEESDVDETDEDEDDDKDAESEDADGDEVESDSDEEDEQSDDEETDEDDSADDQDDSGVEEEESVDEADTPAPVKPEKKKPVIREKKEPKKKALSVEKRAAINPKLSLTKKVSNLLNFGDQRYKQTTYFPLDCETIRILETNVGLYPTEILAQMKADKKVARKIEKFYPTIIIREINKIKSAYSYIVGAIREDKADGKFRNIMTTLLSGKDVPPEVAHYSTVKVARRALLAYLDVTGVDYSVMKDVRKELVKKASDKKEKPVEKVAPKAEVESKPKAEPKAKKEKTEPKAKAESKPAPKKSPKK